LYARQPEGTGSPPKRPSTPNATDAEAGSAAVSGSAPRRRAARARSARAEDAARMIVAIGRARRGVGRNATRRLLIPLRKVARFEMGKWRFFFWQASIVYQSQFSAELPRGFSLKKFANFAGRSRS
jgi:hypothetical protein